MTGVQTCALPISRRDESSELFVRADESDPTRVHRAATIRIRAVAFAELEALQAWLRRELYHLQDMVDPAFGYRPSLGAGEVSAARENLLRDRYRVLWEAWIETRLGGIGPVAAQGVERVFRSSSPEERAHILETVRTAKALTHGDLLDLARSPTPAV